MNKTNQPESVAYTTAAALAYGALFARLLKLLESKLILSAAEINQLAFDAQADLLHPQATEFEGGAAGIVMSLNDRIARLPCDLPSNRHNGEVA